MKRNLRLNIEEPCHQNWDQMTPQEQGRFCGSCQKMVVDFTLMSDQQLLNYFATASDNVCGRLANDQLNRVLVPTPKKKRLSLAYLWNVLLASLLITEASAQETPKPKKAPVTTVPNKKKMGDIAFMPEQQQAVVPVVLKGKAVDAQSGQPLAGMSITIKGQSGTGTSADREGNFSITVTQKDSLVLEFSAIGYETQTRVLNALTNWQDVQVYMKPAAAKLEEVVVISYGRTTGRLRMGGVTRIKGETLKKPFWTDVLPIKKEIKIYPNPVIRGNNIQVSLDLKQEGRYRLELLNAGGQLMLVQPLTMQTSKQLISLHTEAQWSAGIYYVRIIAADGQHVYQEKIIVR